jgi:hypothetical protein
MVTFRGRPHLRNFAVMIPNGSTVLVLATQRTIRGPDDCASRKQVTLNVGKKSSCRRWGRSRVMKLYLLQKFLPLLSVNITVTVSFLGAISVLFVSPSFF